MSQVNDCPRTDASWHLYSTGNCKDTDLRKDMLCLERELNECRKELALSLTESKKALEYERERYNELYHRFPTTAQVMVQMSKEIQLEKDLAEANRKLVLYEAALQSVVDWEKRWPESLHYSYTDKNKCEREMGETHKQCIAALKP